MSYGGHVLDMIKRLNEGREPLKRRRARQKERMKRNFTGNGLSSNLTVERSEEICQSLKQYKQEQEQRQSRLFLICLIVIAATTTLIYLVAKLLFFN